MLGWKVREEFFDKMNPRGLVLWVISILQRLPPKNRCRGAVFRYPNSNGFEWWEGPPSHGWEVLGDLRSSFPIPQKA